MNSFQWFKFSPSDWMMGGISDFDYECQGRFIRFCAYYWNNNGEVSDSQAKRFLGEYMDTLIECGILKVKDGISVSFLDDQLDDADVMKKKKKKAAEARWKKVENEADLDSRCNAGAMQVHTTSNAGAMQKRREEKRRDKKRVEESISPLNPPKGKSRPQSVEDVCEYFRHLGLNGRSEIEAEKFFDHYTANGWKVGGKAAMKDWKAAARNWKKNVPVEKYVKSDKPKMPWV